MKITPESMKKQYEDLWNTFCKKNHDYGSSFEQSLDKHGLIAGVVRMEDKMNRISTLVDGHKNAEIASESLADTLRDLSNYSAMAACWLDGPDDVYNEENMQKFEDHLVRVDEDEAYARQFARMTKLINHSHYGYESFNKMKDQLTGKDEVFEGQFNDIKELVVEQINRSREDEQNKQSLKQWSDALCNDKKETLSTELKGLENGYFIRQHKNHYNSYRYTLAFNPEGTLKVEGDVAKPYVIECFSSDGVDSTNVWAIHVFDTREDMVAALNYDLRVRRQDASKNFGDSIKELDIKVSVFANFDVPRVLDVWEVTFGEAFNNQMLSKNLNTEESIEKYHGIKTFGPVFISEKTGALIIKGTIREDSVKRPCDFIWFGDTKEVLLEVDHTLPKFNYNGIIHGVIYDDDKNVRWFNTLYNAMSDKIMSKFYSWSVSEAGSELKNLVFFNEDEEVESTEDEQKNQTIKQWTDYCVDDVKKTLDAREQYQAEDEPNKPLLTDPLGLENGYFIRQHKNLHNSYRYTLAFNPEGTVRVPTGEKLPYVIECFGNDHDGMTGWAIHVFHSREDMVAALNYDLKVSNKNCSKRFRDSIKGLDVDLDPFDIKYAIPVTEAWSYFFGPSFVKNMTTDNVFNKSYYGIKQGVKTFGPLFISEKTGALVVKGRLRERTNGRIHNIIWFSDTKEVLLELNGMVPKFNIYGIIYGINSEHVNNGKYIEFNPLYQTMGDKILYKFNSWDESKLKNLVFFNEDDDVSCEFRDKKFQIPNDSPSANAKNTVGLDNFGASESGNLTSKNNELRIDFTDSEAYWDEI